MNKFKFLLTILILTLAFSSCNNGERSLTPAEKEREELLRKENELRAEKLRIEKEKIEEERREKERMQRKKEEAQKREKERRNMEKRQAVKKQELLSFFKSNLSPKINEMFLEWGNSWAVDNYTHKSIEIYSITNNSNPWRIKGSFGFTRFGNDKRGTFTAKVSETEAGYSVSNLCYDYKGETNCY